MRYMAHSPSQENLRWQTPKNHVEGVRARLEHHLRYLTLPENVPELLPYGKLTGYLHDLGKYRVDFQKYHLEWNRQTGRHKAFEKRTVEHPDSVFDTGLWTPQVLEKRAQHYGLKTEVSKFDIAERAVRNPPTGAGWVYYGGSS